MRRAIGRLVFAALLFGPIAARADAPPITIAEAHAAVDRIVQLVGDSYVFPEKRAAIVEALKKYEAAGRYDLTNPALFAEALTTDLYAASHDRHMWVHFDPPEPAAPPASGHAPAQETDDTIARNHGFEEMRILPGNLRYVRLTNFMWNEKSTPGAIAEVARFLSEGNAVVVDLRSDGGGDASAVQGFISYFFAPKNQLLMTFHEGNSANETHVLDKLAGPRLTGKPLYVLIDGGTGSAAEEFTYHVKNFHLGTLVGRTTAGAGNNNSLFRLKPVFVFSISTGRPVHLVTGTNWEGTGIAPDVDTPSSGALDMAEALALRALAASDTAHAALYEWYAQDADARVHPIRLGQQQLAAYVGQYGLRQIRLEDGVLVFQREKREPTTLSPVAVDLFAFGNDAGQRARFRRKDGRITGFDMIAADGQAIPVARTD